MLKINYPNLLTKLVIIFLVFPNLLQAQTITERVQEIYVSYYGRPADPPGLIYWEQQLSANGGDLTAIINQFGNSTEYTNRFAGLSIEHLINTIYRNLFGRNADPAGLGFYLQQYRNGTMTLGTIALNIADGIALGSDDAKIINNKIHVAMAYTTAVTANNAEYGAEQIAVAVDLVDSVDGTQESVNAALAVLSNLLVVNISYGQ